MKIFSPEFTKNQSIPKKFTCDGQGFSPTLKFEGIPKEAKSLVLIFEDPDAVNGLFTHWLIWNIPSKIEGIDENCPPPLSITGQNSAGKNEYVSPCPPSGTHRYIFRLFALNTELDLPPNSVREKVLDKIKNHVIDQAELIGLYQRESI